MVNHNPGQHYESATFKTTIFTIMYESVSLPHHKLKFIPMKLSNPLFQTLVVVEHVHRLNLNRGLFLPFLKKRKAFILKEPVKI